MKPDALSSVERFLVEDDAESATKWLRENAGFLQLSTPESDHSLLWLVAKLHSQQMTDLLLGHGLSVSRLSKLWASGFGLRGISSQVAEHLIQRGAEVTPHAAAALGLTQRLRQMLERDPALIESLGGDGARPLHFSRTLEIAEMLVNLGAELDPRDEDHDSTPAQWLIGEVPEATRFLVQRGARPDIFMAAGLNDLSLAKRLVEENRSCTAYRIGNNEGPFPGLGFQHRGGTIYQWTLGFNQSPQEIAYHRGHRELFDFLMSQTPARHRLLIACMLADRDLAESILAGSPGVMGDLDDEDQTLLAKSCWETNLNPEAVRLMLDLGFPIDIPERNHGYTALHNAAWCGDAGLVALLIQRGHPVDRRDPTYQATALGFALHSCLVAKRHPDGNFPEVVRLLLEAGTPLSPGNYPTHHPEIDEVIRSFLGTHGSPPPQ